MTETGFEVSSLSLKRGDSRLFDEMTWQLPKGKLLAVTGPSGAGKSSLLACLSGSITPTAGELRVAAASPRDIGFVFQNFRLTADLSVLTNVLLGSLGRYKWWKTLLSFPETERRKAFQIMRDLEIADLAFRAVRKVSGGEQQRTAVARLLLQNPRFIFADEPTSNLDSALSKRVLSLLRRKCEHEKRTAIIVLHDSRLVDEFADFELKIDRTFRNGWRFQSIDRSS